MQTSSQPSPTTSKKTVSLAIAIILLIVGIAAGTAVGYYGRGALATTLCNSGRTITIGELLDLTMGLSSQGQRAKRSSGIAINDINSFLTSAGCNLKFATQVDDYQLSNTLASTDLASLAASGVQVVVGPLNSGAASTILQYANTNHIVLISPSSTSVALAINNDYLFRTAPNDRWQGQADARMMRDRGATDLIIVQRHDSYGDALANATAAYFKLDGGHVETTIQYPGDPVSDWTTTLDSLQTEFNSARATYAANRIAIDVIAFEEFGSMILKASSTSYPSFPWSALPWFGTDGEAQDAVIVNATYGAPVAQVVLPSTVFGFINNTKTLDLDKRYSAQYGPTDFCDIYCLGAYDDVWLAALATLQAGSYNGAAIQPILATVAANYYGVTGPTLLEASGDRVATTYLIWKVVTQGSAQTWVYAGSWDRTTDSITWLSPP